MSETCVGYIETMYLISDDDAKRIHRDFTHHAPHGDQPARYTRLRQHAKELAFAFLEFCPPSRERSLALTHLETATFYANAAIARNEPSPT